MLQFAEHHHPRRPFRREPINHKNLVQSVSDGLILIKIEVTSDLKIVNTGVLIKIEVM